MRIICRVALLIVLLGASIPGIASANTMYSYVGDTFTSTSGDYTLTDRIAGSFVVADGFVPDPVAGPDSWMAGVISWSFSDGVQTLTQANSSAQINWDPAVAGATGTYSLPTWLVTISSDLGMISTSRFGDGNDMGIRFTDTGDILALGRNGCCLGPSDGSTWGTWTVRQVPEPATLLLVGIGLAAIVAARRARWI